VPAGSGERGGEADRLVWADAVVDRQVVVHLPGQDQAVTDLVPVQVLVLDRLVEPLDHAVGLRRAVPGAHVQQLGAAGDEAREPARAVGRAVVGDDHHRQKFAGVVVDAVLEELVAKQRLGLVDRGFQGGDRVAGGLGGGDGAGQGELAQ
jgi:hypothetical protein